MAFVSATDRQSLTLRDAVAPVFRYRGAGLVVAAAVLGLTVAIVLLLPREYVVEMRFLVKRDRADAVLTADANAAVQSRPEVTEEELNSEVELLKSPGLLEQVAVASGLAPPPAGVAPGSAAQVGGARAVEDLQAALAVTPIKQTRVIEVTYRASDPALGVRVLNQLASSYLERHLQLHRPPGAHQFFTTQAEQFKSEMETIQAQLKAFGREADVVAADKEAESTLRTLSEFDAALQQTQGVIVESTRRIDELEGQMAATPSRQTTQIRVSDSVDLIQELTSRILTLEVKHGEMARKFAPTYPPLLELEEELAQARASLARTQQAPITEQTTDQNPTHQWIRGELAKARTEKAAATARASALAGSIRTYRDRARQLEEKAATQQTLRRALQTSEENYLLYRRKQEEARISDALDRTRIANVVVADEPRLPAGPSNGKRLWVLIVGILVAIGSGLSATYLLDSLSPHFRTPDEVEEALEIPVLATVRAAD